MNTLSHAKQGSLPDANVSVELTRELPFWQIVLIGVGALIGAGVFVLIGSAAGKAGPALLVAFALNGLIVLLTALVYAELGSALPSAGGSYVFVKEGLPTGFSFLAGWMSWFAISVAGSLYALGFGSFAAELFHLAGLNLKEIVTQIGLSHRIPELVFGVGIVALFLWINLRGVGETGLIGAIVSALKVLTILIFAAAGIWVMMGRPEPLDPFQPFAPEGVLGVFLAMGLTFIAFTGSEVIVQTSEEAIDPKRNIPRAIVVALAVVITVYLVVSIALIGGIRPPEGVNLPNWQWLGKLKELGLAEAAQQVLPFGKLLIILGGLLSTMSALNAAIYSSSRIGFAMGRDRYMPDKLGEIHPANRIPHFAVITSGAIIIGMLLTLPLEEVAAAASLMFLLLFMMVNISAIVIRKRLGHKLAYGYVTPFYPLIPATAALAELVLAAVMLSFSPRVMISVVGWIVAGALVYRFYSRPRLLEETPVQVLFEERTAELRVDMRPVLVPVAFAPAARARVRSAARIARALGRPVLILHVVSLPPNLPLSAGEDLAREASRELEPLLELVQQEGVEGRLLIRLAHYPWIAIERTIEETGAELCVLGWRGSSRGANWVMGSNLDQILRRTNTNFVVLKEGRTPIRRVLIPAAHPEQAKLMLAVAAAICEREKENPARIDIIRLISPETEEEVVEGQLERLREALAEVTGKPIPTDGTPLRLDDFEVRLMVEEAGDIVSHLLGRAKEYDLMVVGAGPGGPLGRQVLGAIAERLAGQSPVPVAVVKRRAAGAYFHLQSFFQFFREPPDQPRLESTVSGPLTVGLPEGMEMDPEGSDWRLAPLLYLGWVAFVGASILIMWLGDGGMLSFVGLGAYVASLFILSRLVTLHSEFRHRMLIARGLGGKLIGLEEAPAPNPDGKETQAKGKG